MMQKWNLRNGVIFWVTEGKGIIADLINHTQFECSKGIISFLQGNNRDISEQDLEFLKEKQIISTFDQDAFFKKILDIKSKAPFDGIVYIETTRKCNLRCLGCYNDSGMHNQGEMTAEMAVRVADAIKRLGSPKVIVTGGEPLVLKDWVGVISAFSKNFQTELFSNGTLISESVARKLKEINLYSAKISIDGSNAATHDKLRGVAGSFNRSIAGIKNLQNVGIHLTSSLI